MEELHKREIIEMVRFYGSIASTVGIEPKIKEGANLLIARLLNTLEPEVDRITAQASGISLIS